MRADRGDLLRRPSGARAGPSTSRTRARGRARASTAAQRLRFARKLVAELEALVADRLAFGQRDLERRLAAERRQVVVAPRDRVDADLARRTSSLMAAAAFCAFVRYVLRARARAHFGAIGDFRHRDLPPPAAFLGRASRIGLDADRRRCVGGARPLRAPLPARESSSRSRRARRATPRARRSRCAARRCGPCTQSSNRLLNGAPPHACCSRLMQP